MNHKWRAIYYITPSGDNPVKEFLDEVRPRQKVKALRLLFHIEEYGLSAAISHMKKLTGTPLWEIRILGEDAMRILFVTQIERRIVLLHAFSKKTQKTPAKDIE